MAKVNVNWTQRAEDTLDAIYEYIASDAPLYAWQFIEKIIAAVDPLEDFPLSGRPVPEAERDDIREILFQDYRIIYWVISDKQIDIIGVLHGALNLKLAKNQIWEH